MKQIKPMIKKLDGNFNIDIIIYSCIPIHRLFVKYIKEFFN